MASLIIKGRLFYLQFHDKTKSPKTKQIPLGIPASHRIRAVKRKEDLESKYALGLFNPWHVDTVKIKLDLQSLKEMYLTESTHLAAKTIEWYDDKLSYMIQRTGNIKITGLTTEVLRKFFDKLKCSDVTKNGYRRAIGAFFEWAIGKGALTDNPIKGIKNKKVPIKFPRYMTREEYALILDAIKEHWVYDYVRLNVYLGMRVNELLNLKWDHVKDDKIYILNTETFRVKVRRDQYIPIPNKAKSILTEMYDMKMNDYVISCRYKPQSFNAAYKRFVHQTFGRDSPHSLRGLRHTCMTWLAEACVPMEAIRMYARHSNIGTTMKYAHVSENIYHTYIDNAF